MKKHTPGPWKLDGGKGKKGELYVWSDRDEDGKGYLGTLEVCIATVHTKICEEGIEANARLIAAAPELLAACKALFDRLEREGSGKKETWAAIDQARIAIARAEGE